jgi:hypothetical protein
MPKSKATKNGEQRVTTNRDNVRHLEYFNNGQWRHSDKCRRITNKECTVKIPKSSFWLELFSENFHTRRIEVDIRFTVISQITIGSYRSLVIDKSEIIENQEQDKEF